jgi:integrase
MKITLRYKDIENGNKSLYLDIYENGKRKFEFLSLYLLPEENAYTKARNEETLKKAHLIRAERILHPETIPAIGRSTDAQNAKGNGDIKLMDWIQTYIDWMADSPEYSESIVLQTQYFQERMKEFLTKKRKLQITLKRFDKEWFKAFFLWLQNDYVPQKYVRIETKPLSKSSLRNLQQRIVAIFNRAVKCGKLSTNPFYQMMKADTFSKAKAASKQFLTPDELKLFMSSQELSPGVAETQKAFVFACLTGLRISDIRALRWSNIRSNNGTLTLYITQKKTQELNAVPIASTAMAWMPTKGNDDKVFHLPAHANVDAAVKRIAKKVGIKKNISFHTSRHTFGTLIQTVTGDIETTKKLMGHKSLKSTMVYADVMTEEKVKAIEHTNDIFPSQSRHVENATIPQTKRTAATNHHPRKVFAEQPHSQNN